MNDNPINYRFAGLDFLVQCGSRQGGWMLVMAVGVGTLLTVLLVLVVVVVLLRVLGLL